MTAAIAFSGVLGQRYPLEATRWLWHLIRRSIRVRAVAQIALGNLLDELTGSADGPEPLLRFLATKLRRLVESEADATQRRVAFAAAAQLLGYEVSAQGPVAARVLREHPDQCDRLGRLWALTISSRPHRRTALDALCKTLEALDSRDEGKDIAFRLGAVILPRLGGGALAAVKMTLLNVSREPPLSSAILSSFLDVLKQAATPERDPGTRQFVKTRRETDDYDISDH